jgi:hypothetical protein
MKCVASSSLVGLGIWDKENDILIAWGKVCCAVDPSYEVPKSQDKNAWYSVSELENALRVAGWKDVNRDVVRAKFEQGTNTTGSS